MLALSLSLSLSRSLTFVDAGTVYSYSIDVDFTPSELERLLFACRGQAHIARQDLKRQNGSTAAVQFRRTAEELEKLAAKIQSEIERRSG